MRLRLILIAFILMVTPLPVLATGQPIYNPAILENAGEPAGDIGVPPQVAGIAPWSYGFTFANLASQIIFGVSGSSFQRVHTTKTVNDMVLGKQIEWAGVNLMPKSLQDTYLKLDTKIQPMTGNHVNCFYDEVGGERHTPDERIFKTPWMGGNTLGGGTELLYTIMSMGSLPLTGINLYGTLHQEHVKPDNGLPCFTQDEGTAIGLYDESDTEQLYNGIDTAQFTAELFCSEGEKARFRQCQAENENLPPEEQQDCSLSCGSKAHTVYSTNLSRGIVINERLGRGEDGLCQGFTCALIPKAVVADKKHGTNTQDHTLNLPPIITDDVTTETSVYYMEASLRQHTDIMKCGNTAKGDPSYDAGKCTDFKLNLTGGIPPGPIASDVDNPPAPSCKKGIDEPGFERKPGNLETAITAATAGKIPRCVLQGVANIEGAADEIASGSCSPNQCSATGPFQITVGFTYSGNGASCKKDTTCKACGLSSCPNALEDYVPGTNPCDTASAAKAAVSMLIGKAAYFGETLDMTGDKDAIITAGDSYYGAPVPIDRFGGCSYGEWIYKDACSNSDYVCSPHSLQ